MKSLQINGELLTYTDYGNPASPAIIMLSGWAQDYRLFKNVAPILAESYYVICPDYRGHNPDMLLCADFTSDDLASDIVELVKRLELTKFHLVSHSHGCWVNIEICERLGYATLDKTVLIDWLMEPHPGFDRQLADGQDIELYAAGRKSMADEWASKTDNEDVLNHIYNEMPSFGGAMWRRACREIAKGYAKWGSPLERMSALERKPAVAHIFSQPLAQAYRDMQADFAKLNPWFTPVYIAGETHFPSLENGPQVAAAILAHLAPT
ncbi:alpha/beta hydrolase [Paraburkholderia sp.]|uniref:alpha/beta fold hydrolase n=1 Tax=Paraburkholderia sp. TaxID=1926495 RepID=UPI0023911633|nr:alpha/beta hydrolase [Paraburkholderia sp.]MDE1180511.1 alpha/beta hydrolase [Paraburkholderia sp.]